MLWRIALFVALNVFDIGLSHYSISSGAAVEEGNPFLNLLRGVGGWPLAWAFKMGIALLVVLLLYVLLPRNIGNRMMSALCIGFALVAVYLIGVVAWSQTCPAQIQDIGIPAQVEAYRFPGPGVFPVKKGSIIYPSPPLSR
jgi:Domain of unknown function (DUF5658)